MKLTYICLTEITWMFGFLYMLNARVVFWIMDGVTYVAISFLLMFNIANQVLSSVDLPY